MSVIAKNPILPGFYPDPSICAVGDDFYIVNSSFTYFPGLPVMHSKDLAHWEQIGNVLDRKSQLSVKGHELSRGLFAPTMRYHEGTYYVICTNVSDRGNFIVTATDPAGPWSDPYYLEGAEGIDPSLFFDDDGKCYYIGTHENPEGAKYNGDWYIWIQEIDLKEMKLVGEHKNVWNGAMKNIIWPEGPHIYKRNDYYYIMHAEGGTGPDHAVTVCRSKNIWGPYENNFCNPILTHRHFGKAYPIQYVGHGDLVETKQGEWYMVLLAVRPTQGYTTMGRETFMAKVTWENDWPVVNPGYGQLTDTLEINLPEWEPKENVCITDQRIYDFATMKELGHEFLFLRDEEAMRYELVAGEGMKLSYSNYTMVDEETETYVALRQQHKNFDFSATFAMPSLQGSQKAGLVILQNQKYNLRLELGAASEGMIAVQTILCENGIDKVLNEETVSVSSKTIELLFRMNGLDGEAYWKTEGEAKLLTKDIDVRNLSTEVAGGFVGCTMGVYATWKDMPAGATDTVCVKEIQYKVL